MRYSVPSTRYPVKKLWQLFAVFMLTLALVGAGDDARFNELGHKMMCACGCRQILLQCNHVGCQYSDRMRNELSAGLARGDSDDLVLQAFVQKYGQTVLAAPTTSGFNWVAWIMPFVVFIAGIAAAIVVMLRWKSLPQTEAATAGGATVPDQFRQQARKETAEP
ncbi:MAG: cytochrome c-type biogenesis protein CcmH [Acidobacteriales bacterium]|nr:cytochrome c-type biogenesis protein CcmH [Terriglobales bacterium]